MRREGQVKLANEPKDKLNSEWTGLKWFTKHGAILWTPREDQRLFNSYKKTPMKTLIKLFPDRTYGAIQKRASLLRIPRKGLPYTPDEDSLLDTLYKETELTYRQMTRFFKLRDLRSLKSRMAKIKRQQKWTEK